MSKTKYKIFTKVVWFDFEGPSYLLGRSCDIELIDTEYLFIRVFQN